MIKIFFQWLDDKLRKHMYWYNTPPTWMQTDRWGKTNQVMGTPLMMKGPGHPVARKKCKICNCEVWSNNPRAICGSLKCWLKEI